MFTLFPLVLKTILPNMSTLLIGIFQCIFLFKISKLQRIINHILEKIVNKEKIMPFLNLLKIIFISIYMAHLFACFWYFISTLENSTTTWVIKAGIVTNSWQTKYLYSIYWSFVTMMTVGYGDIAPTNTTEIIACLIALLFGCVIYAYNINSIGTILNDLNRSEIHFQEKINVINNYMNKKKISLDLQRRIREYLRFVWEEENMQNVTEENNIIQLLSGNLREELLLEAYGGIIMKTPVFSENFTEKNLRKTISKIRDTKFFPEEEIFSESEEERNNSIYFIKTGKIELYNESGNIIKSLGIGDYFGEISFFTGNRRVFSARSKDFTTLFSITRKDFLDIMKENVQDYNKFCMIKDQILLYKDYSSLKIKCISCNEIGHLASECPLIHFLPDKEKIIKKMNFYLDNERKDFSRRVKNKKNHSLLEKKKNNLASKIVRKERTKEREKLLKLMETNNFDMSSNSMLSQKMFDIKVQHTENLENPEEEMEISSLKNFNFSSQNDIIEGEDYSNSLSECSNNSLNNDNSEKKITKNQSLNSNTQSHNRTITKKITKESSTLDINILQTLIEKINDLLKAQKETNKNLQMSIPKENIKSEIIVSNLNGNQESKEINKNNNFYLEIDRGAICKNYFDKNNFDIIIDNFNKQNITISKKFRKSLKKQDFMKLSKYTFFTEKMKNIIECRNKKINRSSIEKRNNNEKNSPIITKTLKSTKRKDNKSKIALMATRIIKKFKSKFAIKK